LLLRNRVSNVCAAASRLAQDTLIPAGLWKTAYVTVALLCALKGFQVLRV
jgi:hypothetical protein